MSSGKSSRAKSSTDRSIEDGAYPRHPDDWYVEPSWTTLALLRHENFHGLTLDPACGQGNILRAFQSRGIGPLVGADIRDRGWPGTLIHDFAARPRVLEEIGPEALREAGYSNDWDILAAIPQLGRVRNVVSNPPYGGSKLAVRFVEGAFSMGSVHKVAMFLPMRFLAAERRCDWFRTRPPARIYILSTRPSCPPGDKLAAGEIEAKGGFVDYCWLVWIVGWGGEPVTRWLVRDDADAIGPD